MKTMALTRQGRGVMIVLSDFLQKGVRGGAPLRGGRGYDVFVMQLLSPGRSTACAASTAISAWWTSRTRTPRR